MKKSVLLVLWCILTSGILIAQEDKPKINWMSWEDARAQHKADLEAYNKATGTDKVPPKKVFMDLYTDWCGWCKRMDASTFVDPVIVQYMNKYFYPVKFDAEMSDSIQFNGHTFVNPKPGQKRSTHQFAASILDYQLSYPSYVILDENLNRTVIYKGFKQPEDLLGILLYFGKNQHLSYKQQLETQLQSQKKAAN